MFVDSQLRFHVDHRMHESLPSRVRRRQIFVCAIAQGWIGRVLALAPPHGFLFRHFVFHRLQAGAPMRAIAKGRMARPAARTPPMHASLHFKCQRLGVTDPWFFTHRERIIQNAPQRETEIRKTSCFSTEATSCLSASDFGTLAEVLLSSFGYRWEGTSFRNVAPSHPARTTEEPLTNLRMFIK